MLDGVEDLAAVAVLLVSELVRGEGEDDQRVAELLAELVHLREVSDGGAFKEEYCNITCSFLRAILKYYTSLLQKISGKRLDLGLLVALFYK